MPKIKKTITKEFWKCIKCNHEWEERKETEQGKPFVCPKCKNARWDTKEVPMETVEGADNESRD